MKKITLLMSALLISAMSFAQVVTFDADVDNAGIGTDSNNAAAYTLTKDGVTITVSSGILGAFNSENHYRIYKNQTLTVTSTAGNIASVEFTCTANGEAKYGPGCFTASTGSYTYADAVGTWTGAATEVVFTASLNQVRATQIVVNLGEGGSTTPDQPTEPETPVEPEEPETPAETTTIAEGLALADNATCVLNPFTVVYVANQYVYIEDESAYALLFKYDSGLKAGDKVTGMEVTKTTYADIAQFKPVSMEGLTIVAGPAPAIDEITTAPTVADNHLVKLVNAKLAGAIVANATVLATCSDNTTINIYSKSDFDIENGKAYNIIGGVTQYRGVIQIQAYEVEEYVKVESGVEDVVATETVSKVIKNGQIYIIKGGKTYNALGAEVK
jgi:hypothetical protein